MVDVDHFNESPVSVVIAESTLRSPSFGEETFLSVAIRKQEDTSGNSIKNEDKNAARSSLRKSTGIDALHPLSDVIISSKNSRISSSPIGERNDSYRFSPSIWDSPISPPQHIDDLFGTSNPFTFTDMLRPSSKVSDYFDSAPEDDLADIDQFDDGYASPRRKLSEDGYESIFGMDPLYELSPDQSSPRTLTPDREPTGQLTGENSPYASTFGEHPLGEHPSRTLFVRNINSNVEDDELKSLFEQYGPIRSMYTACKHRGFVMISYYDIRHAKGAMRHLQGKVLRRRKLDIHYSIPKDNPSEKDQNQGTLVVFNLDPATQNEELKEIFQNYGEIKEVRETPNKKHHKFIEFYDVRDAEKAMKNLNKAEIRGKKIKIEPSRPGGARKMSQYYEQQYFDDDDTSSQQSFSGEEFSSMNNSFPTAPKLKPITNPATPGSLNSNNVYRPIKSPPPTVVAQSPNYPRSPQEPGMYVPRNISPSPQTQSGIWSPSNTTKGFNNSPSKSSPFSIIEQNGAKSLQQESRSSDGEGNGRSRSKRSDSNEDKSKFKLVISKVADDGRTTLMIKNIPNKYNQKMLLSAVDEKHKGTYDFFYLPIDFKNKCNVGYAFINFVSCEYIVSFYQEFNGKKWEKFNSEKVCNIAYARIQGKQSLIQHFQNSSLMCEDKKCRPIIFHTLGPHVGEQEPFPVGPNVRRRGSDSSTDR